MKIVVTGGGSGGHITPILAVAHELKLQRSDVKITYIGQVGDGLADIPAADPNIDEVLTIRAGKFRRYHGQGLRQLFDLPTTAKNLRDLIWIVVGCWQAFRLLGRLKPDVVFSKGGFVGVPVCLGAALRRIPYVTHDSDALPGLANRLVAPWAKVHAVALPKEIYQYPPERTETVGVPISHEYHAVSPADQHEYRVRIGLGDYGRVLLMTGGGNGAQSLNRALVACVPQLLERYADLAIVHVTGRAHEASIRQQYQADVAPVSQPRVIVKGFISQFHLYSGAADVILTRAGGTTMAELAAQAKACVVVPNPYLTGGHQLKNARVLADRKAIRIVDDHAVAADPLSLMAALTDLLDSAEVRAGYGRKLAEFTHTDAAQRLAMLLLEQAR